MSLTIESLVHELSKLPGIGRKSAERLTYFFLKREQTENVILGEQISELKNKILTCKICGNFSETEVCPICLDEIRNHQLICIVEQAKDIALFERLHVHKGVYHVLSGLLSPLTGVGPNELNVDSLVERIKKDKVTEIILAINETTEGEMTSLYLKKILEKFDLKITKLLAGIPVGSDLEYIDFMTLTKSFEGRRSF